MRQICSNRLSASRHPVLQKPLQFFIDVYHTLLVCTMNAGGTAAFQADRLTTPTRGIPPQVMVLKNKNVVLPGMTL